MDSEPTLLKEPEAPADAGELMEAAPSRSGTLRSGSVRSGSGSAPAAVPPMVRRRSLVSGAVKAKSAHEEAEMEGLTEEQLLKRRQAFLPSALAANKGFDECAQLLRAAGM